MKIMSVKAAAEKLGVHTNTIYTWVRDHGFPKSFEVGGKSVWDEEDIDNWLKAKKEMSHGSNNAGEAQTV